MPSSGGSLIGHFQILKSGFTTGTTISGLALRSATHLPRPARSTIPLREWLRFVTISKPTTGSPRGIHRDNLLLAHFLHSIFESRIWAFLFIRLVGLRADDRWLRDSYTGRVLAHYCSPCSHCNPVALVTLWSMVVHGIVWRRNGLIKGNVISICHILPHLRSASSYYILIKKIFKEQQTDKQQTTTKSYTIPLIRQYRTHTITRITWNKSNTRPTWDTQDTQPRGKPEYKPMPGRQRRQTDIGEDIDKSIKVWYSGGRK